MSGSKLSVLGHMFHAPGPMTASELAERENLMPQSLTRILADLEEKGLITRRQGVLDRRQRLLEITPYGRQMLIADAERQTQWLQSALNAQLSLAEQGILSIAAELLEEIAVHRQRPVQEESTKSETQQVKA
jgi:DNA-binding MarR family transcriptional regulator